MDQMTPNPVSFEKRMQVSRWKFARQCDTCGGRNHRTSSLKSKFWGIRKVLIASLLPPRLRQLIHTCLVLNIASHSTFQVGSFSQKPGISAIRITYALD